SQAARRHRLVKVCLIAVALVSVLTSCTLSTGAPPSPTFSPSVTGTPRPTFSPSVTGTPTATAPASTNPYHQFDQEVAGLVERQATWQVPKGLQVESTTRIGLVIGDAAILHTQINALAPGTYPKVAGKVKVGSTIGVQLLADPGDASVVPS